MYFNNELSLNRAAKLTNITYPIREYITKTTFPRQNSNLLGTVVTVRYRDLCLGKNGYIDDPAGDTRIKETTMYVLRYDIEEPYIVIGICQEDEVNGRIFVFDKVTDDNIYNYISVYSNQKYNYYRITLKYYHYGYSDSESYLPGYVLRCDDGEPSYAVVAETTEDNKIRFILSDEAICIIANYPSILTPYHESDVYDLVEQLLGEYELYGK